MVIDYQKFFDAAFDLLCVVDATHFLSVNQAWVTVLGYSKEELLGSPWEDFIHPEDRQRSRDRYGQVPSEGAFVNRYITKDGDVVWLEWSLLPHQDSDCVHAVARDISSCKVVEEQLGKSVLKLRRKAEELERSNRDLEQFAYVASHDLQTPLRKVKNFTILLRREYGDVLPSEDAQKYLRFIINGAEKSQALIDGLLAFSRTGRHLRIEETDLNVPLREALSILSEFIQERGVCVTADSLPIVQCDSVLLARVFQNLVGNAVKFRHLERPPRVHVGVEVEGTDWKFTVEDNGVGFDPRHAERIFVIFQRLPGIKQGTGLGLALCKKIIEQHGGRIWAESTPGEGSRFIFTIPQEYKNGHAYTEPPAPR